MISNDWLAAALSHITEGVLIAEYRGDAYPIVYVNPMFLTITGYEQAELLGQDINFLKSVDTEHETIHAMMSAIRDGQDFSVKLRQYTKSGRLFWNQVKINYLRDGERITHVLAVHRDISQEEYTKNVLDKVNVLYREMSRRLEHINETDALTQLKNRGHLSTRGEFMLGAAKREKLRLHAVVIDVDHFKLLNSVGGRGLGDDCLLQVARTVSRYFSRATDIAIRMCNDEFVVICIEDDDMRVIDRAEALRAEVHSRGVKGLGEELHDISVSIGIYSITPEKHTTIEEMIQNAGELVSQGRQGMSNHVAHCKANDSRYPHR
jgi:diguanylate cyclase (GGDEF)-like protein/PAS domain S-box-containing protein